MLNQLFDLKASILFYQEQNRAIIFASQTHNRKADYENKARTQMAHGIK